MIRDFYDLQSDPPISPGPAGALRSHYGSIGCVPCLVLHIPVAVFIPGSLYFLIPPPSPAAPQTRFSFDGHFVFPRPCVFRCAHAPRLAHPAYAGGRRSLPCPGCRDSRCSEHRDVDIFSNRCFWIPSDEHPEWGHWITRQFCFAFLRDRHAVLWLHPFAIPPAVRGGPFSPHPRPHSLGLLATAVLTGAR